jgi:LCP family protein required for cell wall assembly
MMLRIDTNTNQAAVLSFPRDLWVRIGTSNRKSRINSTLDSNDPEKIISTIYTNFGLPVDHLINVDFCAFKGLVDAVGGVAVPFEYAARDRATGLDVAAECHLFSGDEALRYVRSRKYQYFDPDTNEWVSDGTSDLGRITRQQDFLKRTLQKALDKGARDLRVANRLIDSALQYVVTDTNLTPDVMLQVANAMKCSSRSSIRRTCKLCWRCSGARPASPMRRTSSWPIRTRRPPPRPSRQHPAQLPVPRPPRHPERPCPSPPSRRTSRASTRRATSPVADRTWPWNRHAPSSRRNIAG